MRVYRAHWPNQYSAKFTTATTRARNYRAAIDALNLQYGDDANLVLDPMRPRYGKGRIIWSWYKEGSIECLNPGGHQLWNSEIDIHWYDGTVRPATRLKERECLDCGYIVRVTSKWLDLSGAPLCPCNSKDPIKMNEC
jgi:hypothetical protein